MTICLRHLPKAAGEGARSTLLAQRGELLVAEADGQMVVYHAYGLHEGVADGGADERESALLQVFAHGI